MEFQSNRCGHSLSAHGRELARKNPQQCNECLRFVFCCKGSRTNCGILCTKETYSTWKDGRCPHHHAEKQTNEGKYVSECLLDGKENTKNTLANVTNRLMTTHQNKVTLSDDIVPVYPWNGFMYDPSMNVFDLETPRGERRRPKKTVVTKHKLALKRLQKSRRYGISHEPIENRGGR